MPTLPLVCPLTSEVPSQKEVCWVWGRLSLTCIKCWQAARHYAWVGYTWSLSGPVLSCTNPDVLFLASLMDVNWYLISFYISLNISDGNYLYRNLLTIWVPPLVTAFFFLHIFFCWVFLFLMLCMSFLYRLDINVLSQTLQISSSQIHLWYSCWMKIIIIELKLPTLVLWAVISGFKDALSHFKSVKYEFYVHWNPSGIPLYVIVKHRYSFTSPPLALSFAPSLPPSLWFFPMPGIDCWLCSCRFGLTCHNARPPHTRKHLCSLRLFVSRCTCSTFFSYCGFAECPVIWGCVFSGFYSSLCVLHKVSRPVRLIPRVRQERVEKCNARQLTGGWCLGGVWEWVC